MGKNVVAAGQMGSDIPDVMVETSGNDSIYGGAGCDAVQGLAGNDFIDGEVGNDYIDGGNGNDTLTGGIGNDTIFGGDGNDRITDVGSLGTGTWIEHNYFDGGSGNDYIEGNGDNGATNDQPDFGKETLIGGTGDDTLDGHGGDDLYIFNLGDGNDTVQDENDPGNPGNDTIQFSAGIDKANVTFTGSGIDLKIIVDTDGSLGSNTPENIITVKRGLGVEDISLNYPGTADHIENYQFLQDGTVYSYNDIVSNLQSLGTNSVDNLTGANFYANTEYGYDGADYLGGGYVSDTLYGGNGNDYLWGNTGDDLLIGGSGNDYLEGGTDNDTYQFASGFGTDTIDDSSGSNTLDVSPFSSNQAINLSTSNSFTSGSDSVSWASGNIKNAITGSGNDTLTGDSNDNTFTGGSGNDSLSGGSGNDTYKFAAGFGQDTVNDTSGSNTLDFSAFSSNLSVNISGTSYTQSTGNTVSWTSGDISNLTTGSGGDTLTGSTANNTLSGGTGNDTYLFSGSFGNDTVVENANSGTDTVDLSAITNALTVNLTSGSGDEITDGTNTVNWSGNNVENAIGGSGNDTITGSAGDNMLTGGTGNDSLSGGIGNDTYVFSGSFCADTIVENSNEGIDTLDLSAVTANLTINLTASSSDEVTDGTNTINWANSNIENVIGGSGDDSITGSASDNVLTGGIGNDTLVGGTGNDTYVFSVSFGNDSIIENASEGTDTADLSAITNALTINLTSGSGDEVTDGTNTVNWSGDNIENAIGGSANDAMTGNDAANLLTGNAGNDTLSAGIGNDTLDGGVGNDSLLGGSGNDAYIGFSSQTGADVIDDAAGTDSVTVNANSYNAVWSAVDSNADGKLDQLQIDWGSGNSITMDNYFNNTSATVDASVAGTGAIESLVFNDQTLDFAGVQNALIGDNSYTGTTSNDLVNGSVGDDYLNGSAGNDTLVGQDGNDALVGSTGNDSLNGGSGDDVYAFDNNWGVDTITDSAGSDSVDFRNIAGNLTINLNMNSVSQGSNSVTWSGNSIENALGGYNNDTMTGTSADNYLDGSSGDDSISAGGGDDIIIGGTGNDTLDGGTGNNIYSLDNNWGADSISGDAGTATVYLSSVTSNLSINLTSGTGNEVSDSSNTLNWSGDIIENAVGGSGNDTISGSSGDNVLEGGAGNDSMSGGAGNDTYDFNPGFGQDTITDASGSNTLSFAGLSDDIALNLSTTTAYTDSASDSVSWGSGNIVNLTTGSGNDTLTGSSSNNTLAGGTGNDKYVVNTGFGQDTILENANSGMDTLDLSAITNALTINLTSSSSDEVSDGTNTLNWANSSIENVVAGSGNDTISGAAGDNLITGGSGNDSLAGGTGNDTYVFAGNFGTDTLVENAGEGTDTVDLSAATNALTINLASGSGDEVTDGTNTINWTGSSVENAMGGSGNDTITGNSSDNMITGNTGNDSLAGGSGNDIYVFAGNFGTDTISDASGNNTLDFSAFDSTKSVSINLASGISLTQGSNTVSWTLGDIKNITSGAGNDALIGSSSDNQFIAGAGNDTLTAGSGNDLLDGGTGDDTYALVSGFGNDTITDASGNNTLDLTGLTSNITLDLTSDISFTNSTNTVTWNSLGTIQNIRGGAGDDSLTGDNYRNILSGGLGNDTLNGGEGNDAYQFANGWGVDSISDVTSLTSVNTIDFSAVTSGNNLTINLTGGSGNEVSDGINTVNWTGNIMDNAIGGDGNDMISGSDGDNNLTGSAGDDSLDGGDGNDILDGGTGDDSLSGGSGNDYYQFIGNFGTDTITDNSGFDTFDLSNFTSNISINLSSASSFTDGTSTIHWTTGQIENLFTGSGNDDLTANSTDSFLNAGDGNNTLTSGSGNDTLMGGTGNDAYQFSSSWGMDVLSDSDGTNTIDLSAVSSNLTVNLTSSSGNEVSDGTNLINWDGNVIQNVIGGSGNDSVLGNETDNQLTGNDGNDSLSGYAGDDSLTGGNGTDTLVGGSGDDSLDGGSGNDHYVFANGWGLDTITDSAGTDTVDLSNVTANLTVNLTSGSSDEVTDGTNTLNWSGNVIENMITGSGNDTIVGTSGDDSMTARAGNDTLDGNGGSDTLAGGTGNDTFLINNSGITVTENASEGTDTVEASLSYTLGSNLENLILTGSSNLNGTGNTLANILTGNSGNNSLSGGNGNDTLNGGDGVDTLLGGTGDDLYLVDTSTDVITENSNEDTDTVQSSVSYTLGSNLENLTLNGTSNLSGTGNSLNNMLIGNAGNNSLSGGSGNDSLSGLDGADTLVTGAGSDSLNGGSGNDTYTFTDDMESVQISDSSGTDTFDFSAFSTAVNLNLSSSSVTIVPPPSSDSERLLPLLTGSDGSTSFGDQFGNTWTTFGNANIQSASSWKSGEKYLAFDGTGDYVKTTTANLDGDNFTLHWKQYYNASYSFTTQVSGVSQYSLALGALANKMAILISSNGTSWDVANVVTGSTTLQNGRWYDMELSYSSTAGYKFYLDGVLDFSVSNTAKFADAGSGLVLGGYYNGDYSTNGAMSDIYMTNSEVLHTSNFTPATDSAFSTYVDNQTVNWAGSNIENLMGTAGNDQLTGNGLDNVLSGGNGNDTLDGGSGADTLIGGLGDDTYIISDSNKTITENASEGEDTVQSSISYTLGSNVENLTLTGSSNINGTGNTQDNVLIGNSGNNNLSGGSGNDTLVASLGNDTLDGGSGNDIYTFTSTMNPVTVSDASGTDTFDFSQFGSAVNADLSSSSFKYPISGTDTDRLLPLLTGSNGSTSIGDLFGNTWTAQGNANIQSANPWKVGEKSIALDGSGDYIKTTTAGLDGDNFTLHWKQNFSSLNTFQVLAASATDWGMAVGVYNDKVIMYLGSTGSSWNILTEATSGSTSIQTGQWYDFELSYSSTGGYKIYLDGTLELSTSNTTQFYNASSGVVLGSHFNGNFGTAGSIADIYMTNTEVLHSGSFTPATDSALYAYGGSDLIDWSGSTIENLVGTSGNDRLTGNTQNNSITGGAGNDSLMAGSGNDSLNGGTGDDTLNGGTGNDTYILNKGDGQDVIIDSDSTSGNTDILQFGSSVTQSAVAVFQTSGGDLQIGYTDSSGDLITIQSQSTSANAIEQFQLSNGNFMTAADINSVISSMAAYAVTNSVSFNSLADVENNTNLLALVNSGWHS